MKYLQVSFPLVSIEQSLKAKMIIYLGVLSLLIGLIAALLEKEYIKIVFLTSSALLLLAASLFKSYRIIGDLTITERSVITNDAHGQTIYELQELENIQLFLESVKGDIRFSFNTFSLKRGENNCIKFLYREEEKELFFLLDESMISSICSWADNWVAHQVKFILHDRAKLV